MRQRKLLKIPSTTLRDYMVRILRTVGCDEENAAAAAEVFLEADMRDMLDTSHDLL